MREHLDNVQLMTASFAVVPNATFRVDGSNRDRLQFTMGLTGKTTGGIVMNIGYFGELGSGEITDGGFPGSDENHSFAGSVGFVW